MIGKDKEGEYVAECTECGGEEYGGCEENFTRFVAYLRGQGWKVFNDKDEDSTSNWVHLCPHCK